MSRTREPNSGSRSWNRAAQPRIAGHPERGSRRAHGLSGGHHHCFSIGQRTYLHRASEPRLRLLLRLEGAPGRRSRAQSHRPGRNRGGGRPPTSATAFERIERRRRHAAHDWVSNYYKILNFELNPSKRKSPRFAGGFFRIKVKISIFNIKRSILRCRNSRLFNLRRAAII